MSQAKPETDSIYSEETFWLKPLSSLKTWERNYRRGDVDAIANSIARFGFNGALRVWKDETVMAGNHALLALRQLKDSGAPVPVHVSEADGEWYVKTIDLSHLNRHEAEAFAIADNHTQEIGSNEDAQLSAMLKELSEHDETLFKATGYDNETLNALLESAREEKATDSSAEDQSEQIKKQFYVLIDCYNETRQSELLERLTSEGYECRALIS